MPCRKASRIFFILLMITLHTMFRTPGVTGLPFTRLSSEDISGSEILTVFLGSDSSSNGHIVDDITKTEAPRINNKEWVDLRDDIDVNSASDNLTPITRNSRSNKKDNSKASVEKIKKSEKDNAKDDLDVAGSSYYRDNDHIKSELATNSFGELIHSPDESPKIIGVRVTSSVAVGRGNNNPQVNSNPQSAGSADVETARKIKSGASVNKFLDESPTTWRPSHYPHGNPEYHRGVPSNRHTVSTLPGAIIGANPDYILQQKERELNRKRQETMHPYQRSFSYHSPSKEGPRPRSYSYSSVINTFGDPKLTTINAWNPSTRTDHVATEASAGYVTIIDHADDFVVDNKKDNVEIEENVKNNLDIIQTDKDLNAENNHQQNTVPNLPHVYSEPSKIYSEPSKVYSEPSKVYGQQEMIYSEPAKYYSEPAKVYGEPSKVYGEPSKVYGEPSKVYGEPSKVYSQPASVYPPAIITDQSDHTRMADEAKPPNQPEQENAAIENSHDDANRSVNPAEHESNEKNHSQPAGHSQGRLRRPQEQNYEVDESVSVMTNGRTHGVQEKPQDDGQKVGYVVEGRNFRKYRVEERTADGFIVGEYGVVSHDDGSLRGVRYTADGTTNPRLIYDALMKFLSL